MSAPSPRCPLQLIISTLFMLLTVSLGVLLSMQNYSRTSAVILSAADALYDRISNELSLDFRASYTQVSGALALLALSPVSRAATLAQRLEYLPTFSAALRSDAAIAAVQVACADGDYFSVRILSDAAGGRAHPR